MRVPDLSIPSPKPAMPPKAGEPKLKKNSVKSLNPPQEKAPKARPETASHEGEDRLELTGRQNAQSKVLKVYDKLAATLPEKAKEKLSNVVDRLAHQVQDQTEPGNSKEKDEAKKLAEEQKQEARERADEALEKASEVLSKESEHSPAASAQVEEEPSETSGAETGSPIEFKESVLSRIELYLQENNLNQYGDPIGTVYTGGTPLFDESTGQIQNRFEYLLAKFPELTAA